MTGVFITFILAATFSGLFVVLASTLGPKKPNPIKDLPFEAGVKPFALPEGRLPVHFYLVAMLFVLFDVELIFFVPWAVVYKQLGFFGFLEMMVFIFFLVLGFAYAWKKGALEFK